MFRRLSFEETNASDRGRPPRARPVFFRNGHSLKAGATAVLFAIVCAAVPAGAQDRDFRRVIDDCFDDTQPNTEYYCFFSAGKLRMRWSSRDCVIEAAKVGQDGNRTSARQWLKACACGDSEAQDAIERAGKAAVDYAVSQYSGYDH